MPQPPIIPRERELPRNGLVEVASGDGEPADAIAGAEFRELLVDGFGLDVVVLALVFQCARPGRRLRTMRPR